MIEGLPQWGRDRLEELGAEARLMARLKGPIEAGNYLAKNQRVLVGQLLEAGAISHKEALDITEAIDVMHAQFNAVHGNEPE